MIRCAATAVGCAILSAVAAGPAAAAAIRPGGALDLTVSGFAAFQAHGGALDDQRQDASLSTGLDVSTDTELHLTLRGEDAASGLQYGATVELEADTDAVENTGKSWVFVRGAFGELRLGDEDGPVEESFLGAATVAAGTGGIDGEVVDVLAVDAVSPSDSDVATKIRYYTPDFAGLQLGLAYTPNADEQGEALPPRDIEIRDWIEGALVYRHELEPLDIVASLVGSVADPEGAGGRGGMGEVWTWYAGAVAEVGGLEFGAGFGAESLARAEKRYVNAGVAREVDAVSGSITWGRVLRTRGYPGVGEPWNLVVSADVLLLPGLVAEGDVAYFVNDLEPAARRATGGDRGWVWVGRLELLF